MTGRAPWDTPPSPEQAAAVERERQYWEQHEDLDWASDETKREVVGLVPPLAGDVLELCIGSGTFTEALPRTYASYTGVDLSRALLRRLEEKLPHVHRVCGNAEELDFPSESFDAVLVFAGLHHLPRHQRAIADSYRVLRHGGTFFCFEPNDRAWYRKPMERLRDFIGIYSQDEVFLDPRAVVGAMRVIGFQDIQETYLTPRFKPSHLDHKNRLLARLLYLAASVEGSPLFQSFFAISGRKL